MAQEQQREELLIRDRVTGQPRPYYVDANNINLGDDETYKSLPDVLGEMQDDIDDAKEHGGGSVTGVKIGDTTYDPDQQGVVDISPAIPDVSGKANKSEMSVVPGTGENADKTTITLKEGTSATVLTQHQDISMKANSSEVVKGINDSNGNPLPKNQDGTITLPAVQAGDQVSVIQPDPADGTFTIRVGSDDFTVNLNHTHEGMAKLVVCEESDLPSTLDPATIYGVEDDGEISVLYIGGVPFYGGGASSGPVIRRPAPGSTIDMGQTASGTVSQTINVKGNSLTQALTIELDGTGYSFGTTQPSGVTRDSSTQLTVTAAAANTLNGVDIVVVYTGNDTDENVEGTIGISSGEGISSTATLIANKVVYELVGVKLTGTQWLQTDYYPNANTEFEMTCKFIENSHSLDKDNETNRGYIFRCQPADGETKRFNMYQPSGNNGAPYNAYGVFFVNEESISYSGHNQVIQYAAGNEYTNFLVDGLKIFYRKSTSNGVLGVDSGGTEKTITTSLKTTTMTNAMVIGKAGDGTIYSRFQLVIYELKIKENGTVVRDWVPEERNGVVGLLDVAANGTGTFISSETAKTSGLTTDELVAVYQPQNNN